MKRFAIALLFLCGCHAFSQVTFISKSKDIYIFKSKGITMQATCSFTDRPMSDGTPHDIDNYCPLNIVPSEAVGTQTCEQLPAPNPTWLHHKRNTYADFNTETLWISVEDCAWENQNTEAKSKDEEDWGWTGKERETIYFKVRGMTKE